MVNTRLCDAVGSETLVPHRALPTWSGNEPRQAFEQHKLGADMGAGLELHCSKPHERSRLRKHSSRTRPNPLQTSERRGAAFRERPCIATSNRAALAPFLS